MVPTFTGNVYGKFTNIKNIKVKVMSERMGNYVPRSRNTSKKKMAALCFVGKEFRRAHRLYLLKVWAVTFVLLSMCVFAVMYL